MIELLVLSFVGLFVWAAMREARLRRERVQRSFEAIVVQTPEGPVGGDKLLVVKEVIDTSGASEGGDDLRGVFRYCVGPGPTYFVVIGQVVREGLVRSRLQWVVRPLSEERMRGALHGDHAALAAAFGGGEKRSKNMSV